MDVDTRDVSGPDQERAGPVPSLDGFADLGLDPRLLSTLQALGYEEPTPVQLAAIPLIRAGGDLIGRAATGTGKTAAFALPMLERMGPLGSGKPRGLVLVPTRELAVQVAQAIHRYGREMEVTVLPVYGGQAISQQLRALRRGVDVVVATPGRALDLLRRGSLVLDRVTVVVLDEADEMLDMGFAEDLDAILTATPPQRQTVLFSATLPARVAALAKRHLRQPHTLDVPAEKSQRDGPRVPQTAYIVPRGHKLSALGRVLDLEAPASAIVFCRTRTEVDDLTVALAARGYRPEALHGGLAQDRRDRVMQRFRSGAADLLIATDVAARGLDIPHVSHVVNFDVPSSTDAYIHRIGRTGRAGRTGSAITLAEPRERRLLLSIEKATGQRIQIASLPTVADLRARQMQLTRAAVEDELTADDFGAFRVIVEALGDAHDVVDIAAAAIKLAHDATRPAGESEDIPEPVPEPPRRSAAGGKGSRASGKGEWAKGKGRPARSDAPPKDDWVLARIFIGAGRDAGVRPADLVGAIANETGISPRLIGNIEIADRFSIIEVPEEIADSVIAPLRAATIRGRRVTVRRDRF